MGNGYPTRQPDDLSQLRADLSKLATTVRDLGTASGAQRNASISDLRARSVYAATAPGSVATFGSAGLPDTSTGLSLTFSLDESRRVLVQTNVGATLGNGGSSLMSVTSFHIVYVDDAGFGSGGASSNLITSTSVSMKTPMPGTLVFTLPAGEHTVTSTVSATVSGNGNGSFESPSLVVSVMQKA